MILFSASEAGSAVYLSKIIKNFDKEWVCISSKISKTIFDKNGIKNELNFSANYLNNIDLILTGTCLNNGIDKKYIKLAKEKNIPCISIVEHWSLYKKRFLQDGKLILPDFIFLNDTLAKEQAHKEGLPKDKLIPIGNPVLEDLALKKVNNLNIINSLENSGVPKKLKIITFISEVIRKDFPKNSCYYQGFNEFQVVEDICSVLTKDHHLIIKLHPAEKKKKYAKYHKGINNISIIKTDDFDSIINNSDFIVGMGSMFLLEASIFRSDIISYRPNEKIEFIGNKLGTTYLIKDKTELKKLFTNNKIIKNKNIAGNFIGSTERIVNFIKEQLR